MLSPLERDALSRLRALLETRFGTRLVKLTLFGSRARGEGDEESDLDVLVCVHDLTRSERREALDVAYDLELALGVRIDPILRDAEPAALGAALASEILRDGVTV